MPKNYAKHAILTVHLVAKARPLIIGVINEMKIHSVAMFEFRHQFISICKDVAF